MAKGSNEGVKMGVRLTAPIIGPLLGDKSKITASKGGVTGYGKNEQEAIEDLKRQLGED